MADAIAPLTTRARAKVNLTLRVLGRRADGYHELCSLVAFAGTGDSLALTPAPELSLTIAGPQGAGLEVDERNLVLRAAHALASETGPLRWGGFHLVKRLPVASGIGGGSADAAAALRLLARLNDLSPDDPRLLRAAARIGADVPVCLASRARVMEGVGDRLGEPLRAPPLFALLVNPGVAVETAAVFRELGLQPGELALAPSSPHPEETALAAVSTDAAAGAGPSGASFATQAARLAPQEEGSQGIGLARSRLLQRLAESGNDLEDPASRIAPVIATVLAALRDLPGCRLARMSGSGATCFALFDDCRASAAAGRALQRARPGWWVKATILR